MSRASWPKRAKRIAVIGGGIGGLSAAGELAQSGHQVTLFEAGPTLGGKAQVISEGGVVLDTGPTLLTMPDTVRETFRRLGGEDLLPAFHRLPLQCEYRFSDGQRFSCFEDLERTVESAAKLDAVDAKALPGFYADAEAIYRAAGEPYLEAAYDGLPGFLGRVMKRGLPTMLTGLRLSTLHGLAKQHFRTPHFQNFVGRFATYAGGSPFETSAAFAMIPHLERAFGVHHVEGGMGALVRALANTVRRLNVDIRTGTPASWVERNGHFIVAEEDFDSVVVNADPLAATGRATGKLATSGYVFFLEAGAPVTLPHHLVSFSSDYAREFEQIFSGEIPDDPTIYVCRPSATDPGMGNGLFVMVNTPAFTNAQQAAADWPAHAERLQRVCLGRLRREFSELAQVPLKVLGQRTPVDLARTGAPGGSIYGFLPHGKFGPFRRPHLRGQVPGLFYAGGGTHPGGGVPLVMLSGRFAAGLVNAHVRSAA